jgi:DNA replication protein DnaC
MDMPGQVWDELVASSLRRVSTTGSADRTPGRRPLLLNREPVPLVPPLDANPREIGNIPTPVRAAIRQVVTGSSPWPLFLHGPAGVGKTCAALCLFERVPGGLYYSASEFATYLADAGMGRLSSGEPGRARTLWPHAIWERALRAPLFILDELGCRDQVSDHAFEVTKRVLDVRLGKPVVAISNHNLEGVARLYDDRVASRLAAGTVVEVLGDDLRLVRQ